MLTGHADAARRPFERMVGRLCANGGVEVLQVCAELLLYLSLAYAGL